MKLKTIESPHQIFATNKTVESHQVFAKKMKTMESHQVFACRESTGEPTVVERPGLGTKRCLGRFGSDDDEQDGDISCSPILSPRFR